MSKSLPQGRAFAEADILRRKELFRAAALEHIAAHTPDRALARRQGRSHACPTTFFEDLLDEHFSEEEAKAQLETAIGWGRYAELFDHDSDARRFFIPEEALSSRPEPEAARVDAARPYSRAR